ncbi:MAG: hypothetical protein NWE93_09730 [Candidatus Bathyarchaeota archaeon]|nr:hypothetical protein [Candidatus Bathyarchaeota archaeon]
MHKILKVILAVIGILVIVGFAAFSLVIFDAAGNFATGTHPLPNDSAKGKALVVYDPGLSGRAKDVASYIGFNIQDSGYYVTLAGVKSDVAANPVGYDIIVVGGPIYAGKPATTIQAYLDSLNPPQGTVIGAFGYGDIAIDNSDQAAVLKDVAPLPGDSSYTIHAAAKVNSGSDLNTQCQEFVMRLLR